MRRNDVEQERFVITEEKMQQMLRKIPNWKAPGPDGVQGYWLKNFKSMHKALRKHLEECLKNGTPNWMTKGRTILMQKDKEKGNIARAYKANLLIGHRETHKSSNVTLVSQWRCHILVT